MKNKKLLAVIAIIVILATVITLVVMNSSDEDDTGSADTTTVSTVDPAEEEKTKEANDAARIRAAVDKVTRDGEAANADVSKTVQLDQTGAFEYVSGTIGYVPLSTFANKTSVTVTYHITTGEITFE